MGITGADALLVILNAVNTDTSKDVDKVSLKINFFILFLHVKNMILSYHIEKRMSNIVDITYVFIIISVNIPHITPTKDPTITSVG